jgi:hypothetical protein
VKAAAERGAFEEELMSAPRWAMRSAPATWLLVAVCVVTPAGPASGLEPTGSATGGRPQVKLPPASLKLLPLEVRLRRIAAGVGVPADDAVFDAARAQRLALGAHDFVNGTAPDLQWNSQRMAVWTAVILPVCRDSRVRTYLGDWRQGGVARFAEGAFGRASTADDLADLAAVLALAGDDGWVATCLALASSAEVLLQ